MNKFLVIISAVSSLVIVIAIVSIAMRPHPIYVAPSDFNFVAVGDWGCTDDTADTVNNIADTVNNIADKNPEIVLGLGDYSYDDSEDCWFYIVQPIDNTMKISIGNHDHREVGKLPKYMNHFGLTQQYYYTK